MTLTMVSPKLNPFKGQMRTAKLGFWRDASQPRRMKKASRCVSRLTDPHRDVSEMSFTPSYTSTQVPLRCKAAVSFGDCCRGRIIKGQTTAKRVEWGQRYGGGHHACVEATFVFTDVVHPKLSPMVDCFSGSDKLRPSLNRIYGRVYHFAWIISCQSFNDFHRSVIYRQRFLLELFFVEVHIGGNSKGLSTSMKQYKEIH